MKNKASVVAAIAFLLLLAFVIFVPWLSNEDPYALDFSQAYQSPSWAHPFGTDGFGRDLLVRTALGGRVSFAIGFAATFAIMVVGIVYGATAGFLGGHVDNALMRFLDALYGLPYLPFAIMTLAVFGTVNFWTMVVALTIASWFTTARVMRGQIFTLKQNDYVRAAYAVGAKGPRVLYRHLLMNTLGVIIVFVFLELPGVILGEAFLSFLGLGINPPKASWGTLAQDGYTAYQAHPYIIVIPSICIAWLILSAFFIADGLRDALDPRTKEAWRRWRCSKSRTSARTSRPARARCTPSTASRSRSRRGRCSGSWASPAAASPSRRSRSWVSCSRPGRVVSGAIRFEGRELTTMSDKALEDVRGKQIAMIFQDPMTSLNPTLTIGTQITETIRRHLGLSKADADKRAVSLLEEVHIPDAKRRLQRLPPPVLRRDAPTRDDRDRALVQPEAADRRRADHRARRHRPGGRARDPRRAP